MFEKIRRNKRERKVVYTPDAFHGAKWKELYTWFYSAPVENDLDEETRLRLYREIEINFMREDVKSRLGDSASDETVEKIVDTLYFELANDIDYLKAYWRIVDHTIGIFDHDYRAQN